MEKLSLNYCPVSEMVAPYDESDVVDWIDEIDVNDRRETVKRKLNTQLMLAKKYGYEECEEEILSLLAELDSLR